MRVGRWKPFIGGGTAVVAVATPTVTVTPATTTLPTPDLEEINDPDLGRWPKAVLQHKTIILSAAKIYRIEPKLFSALIYIESWLPYDREKCPDGPCTGSCTSDSGAIGPAQVMPFHFPEGVNGRDPAINIPKGMEILREYIDLAGGEIRKGLAFYNCGPTGFEVNPTPCWKYADDVLHEYKSR